MKARFPASRLQSPILHFRRLREPPPPPPIPAPTLPSREQRILIRLMKTLYENGFDELRLADESVVRHFAKRVVQEFFAEQNEEVTPEECANIVQVIMKEAPLDNFPDQKS
jgi:hypothetical protein